MTASASLGLRIRRDVTVEQITTPRSVSARGFPSHLLREMGEGTYCFIPVEQLVEVGRLHDRLRVAARRLGYSVKLWTGPTADGAEFGVHVWRFAK